MSQTFTSSFLKRLILAFAALFIATPALAAPGWSDYDAQTFAQAQKSGKIIVVDVHADWCPTCRAQAPILTKLMQEPRLKNALFVKVNFDTDKDFLRAHRIPRQSTILVFKGTKETARSIAETRPAKLRSAVFAGL